MTLTDENLTENIITSIYFELKDKNIEISGPFVFGENFEDWFYPCGEMKVRQTEEGKNFIQQNGIDLFEITGNEIKFKVDSNNGIFLIYLLIFNLIF